MMTVSRIPVRFNSATTPSPVRLRRRAPAHLPPLLKDVSPKFSIKRVTRVTSTGAVAPIPGNRKHSDDFEVRRQGKQTSSAKRQLSSVSMEHINSTNVLYCVRDSNELLHAKMASSSSYAVDRYPNQAAKLYKDIEHPKAFKHPTVNKQSSTDKKRKSSYAAMHAARRDLEEKQKRSLQRKQHNITKQCYDNQLRHRKQDELDIGTISKSTYPHTLPSAMYPRPPDYHALYGYSPLPAIFRTGSTSPEQSDESSSYRERRTSGQSTRAEVTQATERNKANGSYAAPKPEISYKPYTQKEYDSVKVSFGCRAGGLGPDTENDDYKSKAEKARRMALYAKNIRLNHQFKRFPQRKSSSIYQPPSKSEIALEYSRTIPPPKPCKMPNKPILLSPHNREPSSLCDDILRERIKRHLQHKRYLEDLNKL